MSVEEIDFEKYRQCGAYHWLEVSNHPIKRNTFTIGRYKNVIALLKKAFGGSLKEKNILDVGCGDGVLSFWMAKEGAKVTGIDNSTIALEFAKRKTNKLKINYMQASAYKLPFSGDFYDAVVSADILEHLASVNNCLIELKRVLKCGGMLVTSTPIRFPDKPLQSSMHVTEWFPGEFRELIDGIFPGSKFYESHPLFWHELIKRSIYLRCTVNLISFFRNPFEGFKDNQKAKVMQFSVSTKTVK